MEISRPMRLSVYREKSVTTASLCKAMCEASLKFAPLTLDSTGKDEDGHEYRYASLAAMNKATSRALWEQGVWTHADYGLIGSTGRYISVTLEKDDEWVTSYLDIPPATTMRKRKALMTQLRRAAIEGLLNLAAEQDNDAEGVEDAACNAAAVESSAAQAEMLVMAKDAIRSAANRQTVEAKLAKARQKSDSGELNPADLPELEKLAEQRIKEIEAAAKKAGVKPEAVGAAK